RPFGLSGAQSKKRYLPVAESKPTQSGSPPDFSISFSDHNFSGLASSLCCTFAHSMSLCRITFCSKRDCRMANKSSCSWLDSCFLIFIVSAYLEFQYKDKILTWRNVH